MERMPSCNARSGYCSKVALGNIRDVDDLPASTWRASGLLSSSTGPLSRYAWLRP